MARHIMIVFSEPAPGRDDEYNQWYNEQHVVDMLTIPAVNRVRRYRAATADQAGQYLAIYELECDDPAEVAMGIAALAERGELRRSDAIVPGSQPQFYTLIAEAE
jgi:hypothetical protein